ncbi:MAG: DUF4007 family protein [Planctomycetes bacterium]|nr:DUF4007 family protein [Planctomycetota bacterium]MBU4401030.1 DUF4007 family protein [Planctomycetota bacterium]MCG2684788.1 DUF4007 family protein [Planctomycetales bacterium]
MSDTIGHNRLPRNFHKTFKPERQYIHAMLRFAASGQEGDYQAIAAATGIPTGASSGKVPAILDYCRGMGLLRLAGQERSAVKKPELTPFGRVVLLEDPYLKASVSQWIAHLNLCGPIIGADVWYQTFFPGTQSLGMNFARDKLEAHLNLIYSVEKAGLIGPMIGMYEDDAAFHVCGVLSETSGQVLRKPAPVSDEFGFGYGAWLLQMMADHFPETVQVPATDLDAKAGWRTIPGWDIGNHQRVLQLVERKGLIEVDRHMEPWLLRPAVAVESTWKRIYDDLL